MTPAPPPRYRLELVREDPDAAVLPFRCSDPGTLVGFLWRTVFARSPSERLVVVWTDHQYGVIGWSDIALGTAVSVCCDPRLIFASALLCNASAIVVAHNHPSGEVTPSEIDLRQANRLASGGEILGLPLVDFLIVGGAQRYTSLRDRGFLMDSTRSAAA
jgi:DNA repair protein RadC